MDGCARKSAGSLMSHRKDYAQSEWMDGCASAVTCCIRLRGSSDRRCDASLQEGGGLICQSGSQGEGKEKGRAAYFVLYNTVKMQLKSKNDWLNKKKEHLWEVPTLKKYIIIIIIARVILL